MGKQTYYGSIPVKGLSAQIKYSQSIKLQVCPDVESPDILLLYPIFVDSVTMSAKPNSLACGPASSVYGGYVFASTTMTVMSNWH